MPKVADYSIVTDAWVIEAAQHTINFEIPSNIDAGSRSILGFMLDIYHLDSMNLTLHLNGTKVWSRGFPGDSERVHFFQEVIAAGVVKPGTNALTFDTTSSDATAVQLSDVVIWWQANI